VTSASASLRACSRCAGKCDPSRGRGTRAGDHDDPGGLRDCADDAHERRGPSRGAPPPDRPTSNRRGPDHRNDRWRRGDCSGGRSSGEAARPRCRRGGTLRLDTARKPWHKRDDWLGPAKHRSGHRGSGGISSRPSSRPTARPSDSNSNPVFRGGARRHQLPRVGALTTAAERLHGSSLNAEIRNGSEEGVVATGVQIYAVLGER
jgi:hypothetical protein